jgi:sorting nexin-27
MLPDRSVTVLKIKRFSTAEKVYQVNRIFSVFCFRFSNHIHLQAVIEKIGLPHQCAPYFYLFEILDYTFGKLKFETNNIISNYILERKLRPNEYPHQIYVQNCCTANTTCLCLRKFIFSSTVENQILQYPLARDYLYREVR